MTGFLLILAPLAMIAVLFVLGRGIFFFAKGAPGSGHASNRMMQWRIALQFVAVIALALLLLAVRD